ncbi:hypothetical protein SAMN04487852_11478 [Prevotella sp. tf2-5]|nr:hypothetical protein SAMN04487852_11478 [Prevotella sp. tf2-5]
MKTKLSILFWITQNRPQIFIFAWEEYCEHRFKIL